MPKKTHLSIPFELHKIKAQQIYEQRIAEGKEGSPEADWETAQRYLCNHPNVVQAWKIKQAINKILQPGQAFYRRLWKSFKSLINLTWKIISFPFWLPFKLNTLYGNADTRTFALEVTKTIISLASLVAAIIAAVGLFVNYQDAVHNRQLTEERLITDRFTKAVEQIGDDKEEVVIGGIYSLERIAKDSPKDQWTIMEVLTAFVRKNSPIPPEIIEISEPEEKNKALEKLEPVNIQVQTALTVIGRRNPDQDNIQENKEIKNLDLSNSNLRGADLKGANLSKAKLSETNLKRAKLSKADLRGANLSKAKLSKADLRGANLSKAKLSDPGFWETDFSDADLSNANLSETDFIGVYFNRANLNGANLTKANLTVANFREADLKGADLSDADLSDADLSYANLRQANLTKANFHFANLSRANLSGANLNEAILDGTDLSRANLSRAKLPNTKNLSNAVIKSACFWDKAIYTDTVWSETEQKWNIKDEQANQKKIEEIRQDKASDPKIFPNCNRLEYLRPGGSK